MNDWANLWLFGGREEKARVEIKINLRSGLYFEWSIDSLVTIENEIATPGLPHSLHEIENVSECKS